MKFLALSFFLLTVLSLFAKSPDDFDHEHKGCPMNTTCTKELGDFRNEIKRLVKAKNFLELNRLKSKVGFLFPLWLKPNVKSTRSISWDSACPHHQKERKYQLALVPLMNFGTLSASDAEEIFFPYMYLEENSLYTRYQTLRSSLPIFLDGSDFYYAEEIDGNYYGIKVSKNGSYEVIPSPEIIEPSRYVECPQNLQEITKEEKLESSPYTQFYCKEIWNKKTKKFQRVIMPYSCS